MPLLCLIPGLGLAASILLAAVLIAPANKRYDERRKEGS